MWGVLADPPLPPSLMPSKVSISQASYFLIDGLILRTVEASPNARNTIYGS